MGRKKKGRCGRPRSKSAPAVLRTPTKCKKRKQWSEEAMVATAILEEKEPKKRQELEEKNKRKAEREQKKKEREEAAKKVEERTKKKEELAKKRENTTRKRSKSTGAPTKKRKTSATAESDASSSAGSSSSARQSSRSAGGASPGKDGEPEVSIYSDECCVCFRTFQEDQREGTGLEWVQCVCQIKGGSMKNVYVK